MSTSEPPPGVDSPAVAPAATDVPASGQPRVALPACANCGTPTTSRYCPDCGQEMRDTRLSLPQLLHEFTDEYLNLDSRVVRSIGHLLFRPGRLTEAYIEGKRQRHVRPFRMYLIASILFFTVATLSLRSSFIGAISLDPDVDSWFTEEFGLGERAGEAEPAGEAGEAEAAEAAGTAGTEGGAAEPAGTGVVEEAAVEVDAAEPAGADPAADARSSGRLTFEDRLKQRAEQVGERGLSGVVQSAAQQFWTDLPKLMFVLLPFFALFLKVLYLRRGRSYVEHFIFSLHVHSFVFIVFTALVLLRQVPHAGWLAATIPLYVFVAQKRVYGQGFVKTALKYLILGWAYFLAVTVALAVTILLILWFV
jgi:hypothetical protein